MYIKFFLTLLLFKWVECCMSSPYTHKKIDTDVAENLQTFPWLVVIKDKEDFVFKLGYGALVHPQVVITSALTIQKLPARNLSVQTNCSIAHSWVPTDCIEREVVKVIIVKHRKKFPEHDYVLLILDHFLPINPIDVVSNVDSINLENCYFLRWMRGLSENWKNKKLLTVKYKTSFNDGHLNVSSFNPEQLRTDRDFIISRKFHAMLITLRNEKFNSLNFMGSPLICQHKKNPEHYVLSGIGTFNLRIKIPINMIEAFSSNNSSVVTKDRLVINIINQCKHISRITKKILIDYSCELVNNV